MKELLKVRKKGFEEYKAEETLADAASALRLCIAYAQPAQSIQAMGEKPPRGDVNRLGIENFIRFHSAFNTYNARSGKLHERVELIKDISLELIDSMGLDERQYLQWPTAFKVLSEVERQQLVSAGLYEE